MSRLADKILAFHEAAHGVTAIRYSLPLEFVTTRPDGGGHAQLCKSWFDRSIPSAALHAFLHAGRECEMRLHGDEKLADAHASHDFHFSGLLRQVDQPETARYSNLAAGRALAKGIVETDWRWIARVANELLAHRYVTAARVRELRCECR